MNLLTITKTIHDVVVEHCAHDVRVFLFGSTLMDFDGANDIDILIVGEVPESVHLRLKISSLPFFLPIHVLIMSDSEESELEFIKSVGGQLLSF